MNDLISRQAAIMHFVKASKNYECGMFSLAEVTHELWEIASAQRTGEWIERDSNGVWECNQCHKYSMIYKANYCPFCGAKMKNNGDD